MLKYYDIISEWKHTLLNIYGKTCVSVIRKIMYVFSVLMYEKNFNILNVCMYKKIHNIFC